MINLDTMKRLHRNQNFHRLIKANELITKTPLFMFKSVVNEQDSFLKLAPNGTKNWIQGNESVGTAFSLEAKNEIELTLSGSYEVIQVNG